MMIIVLANASSMLISNTLLISLLYFIQFFFVCCFVHICAFICLLFILLLIHLFYCISIYLFGSCYISCIIITLMYAAKNYCVGITIGFQLFKNLFWTWQISLGP